MLQKSGISFFQARVWLNNKQRFWLKGDSWPEIIWVSQSLLVSKRNAGESVLSQNCKAVLNPLSHKKETWSVVSLRGQIKCYSFKKLLKICKEKWFPRLKVKHNKVFLILSIRCGLWWKGVTSRYKNSFQAEVTGNRWCVHPSSPRKSHIGWPRPTHDKNY